MTGEQPQRVVYDDDPPLLFSIRIGGEDVDAKGIPLGTMLRIARRMYGPDGLATRWSEAQKTKKKATGTAAIYEAVEQLDQMAEVIAMVCEPFNPKVNREFLLQRDSMTMTRLIVENIQPVIDRFVESVGGVDLKNL